MKETATLALAMAAVITGACADNSQAPPDPKAAPQGGTFNLNFSNPAGNLGSLTLGKVLFSRSGEEAESIHHSRQALLIKDRYIVFQDNSATTGINWNWKGAGKPLAIFLTHPEGKTLKPIDKSLQQLVLKKTQDSIAGNIAIITTAPGLKVNGMSGKPGLNLASGINYQMAVAQTNQGIDRIFWGSNDKPARLNSAEWKVNAHSAIIREIGNNTTQLAAFGDSGKSNNLIATRFITLEIEGENVAIEATVASPGKNAGKDPEVTTVRGNYMAEKGGKLRLNFGSPTQKTIQESNRLLAFWKFDEGKGKVTENLKEPLKKAKLVDINTKKAWVKGTGFGKSTALTLDGVGHIETLFDKELQGSSSIAIWVRTKSGGLVWEKGNREGRNLLPGSRIMEITPDGGVTATLTAHQQLVLQSATKINDGKWHHVAWVTDERPDEGLRVPLAVEHRLYVDAKLEDTIHCERLPGSKPVLAPLRIGGPGFSPSINGEPRKIPGLTGDVDNLRIFNFPLTGRQLNAFHMVGIGTAPFVITSEPRKTVRVGEKFEYPIKFTGVPFASFKINTLPEWIKFEGLLTGIPTQKDIGISKKISIVGMSPLGPGQQIFSINVLPPLVAPEWKVHVNGSPVPTRYTGLGIEADLPAGSGNWLFTNENLANEK